jgi:hypothetical protein
MTRLALSAARSRSSRAEPVSPGWQARWNERVVSGADRVVFVRDTSVPLIR